jgi:hypothetical protein
MGQVGIGIARLLVTRQGAGARVAGVFVVRGGQMGLVRGVPRLVLFQRPVQIGLDRGVGSCEHVGVSDEDLVLGRLSALDRYGIDHTLAQPGIDRKLIRHVVRPSLGDHRRDRRFLRARHRSPQHDALIPSFEDDARRIDPVRVLERELDVCEYVRIQCHG